MAFVGLIDPAATREQLRKHADSDRGAIGVLLQMIATSCGEHNGTTTAELLAQAETNPKLRAAILEVVPARPGEAMPTAKQLSGKLRALKDRTIAGMRLAAEPGHGGITRWRCTRSSVGGAEATKPTEPTTGQGRYGGFGCSGGIAVADEKAGAAASRTSTPETACDSMVDEVRA